MHSYNKNVGKTVAIIYYKGSHPLFSAFSQQFTEYARKEGLSPYALVLTTVPVH